MSKVWWFYLGWSDFSSVQTKYNKGRFKVMATYLQQLYNFEPTFIHWLCFEERAKFLSAVFLVFNKGFAKSIAKSRANYDSTFQGSQKLVWCQKCFWDPLLDFEEPFLTMHSHLMAGPPVYFSDAVACSRAAAHQSRKISISILHVTDIKVLDQLCSINRHLFYSTLLLNQYFDSENKQI